MSDMKCPFCQQELDSDSQSWEYGCSNPDCETTGTMCGSRELWQELIRTRKALDIAVDALNAVTATPLNSCVIHDVANKALEQITTLEQKDVK